MEVLIKNLKINNKFILNNTNLQNIADSLNSMKGSKCDLKDKPVLFKPQQIKEIKHYCTIALVKQLVSQIENNEVEFKMNIKIV